ncbi:MAG: DUF4238 domain-containing protein [Candidatus Eisenbacteria bacterium]|nr:DUF4238 domain-containing protein [Candidatus Eisenbacteria bacterium]
MNTKQHFLPAGFLKNFSASPSAGREAPVWAFDGQRSFQTAVKNVCVEGDFYTFDREQEFNVHGELETGLFDVLPKLLDGDRTDRVLVSMLFHACYLHIRGREFENASGVARLNAIQTHGVTFICRHVLRMSLEEQPLGRATARLMVSTALTDFHFEVVRADTSSGDTDLYCSDNPVAIFTRDGRPDLLVLPLTATQLFVAARASAFETRGNKYDETDAAWANSAQCYFTHRQVFSRHEMPEQDRMQAAALMRRRPKTNSALEPDSLTVTPSSIPKPLPSFLVARVE